MKMKLKKVLLIMAVFQIASGCVDNSNAEAVNPESEFYEVYSGVYTDSGTYTEKQAKIITSQSTFESEYASYSSTSPALIDFSSGTVLLVDMGVRNSGGYSIAVASVSVSEDSVTANIKLSKPGNGCFTTQALTNPYQFVYIPTKKEVLITESIEYVNCGV